MVDGSSRFVLLGLKDFAGLLMFGQLTFLVGELLAHFGDFLFLFADLFQDDFDWGLFDPALSGGLGSGC
jgi:hypothetical protein